MLSVLSAFSVHVLPTEQSAGYSVYWKVLNNLGTWSDPRYLEVKIQRANGGEWVVKHRREVMPVCVLKKVRTLSLYPNPEGKFFMDHKWK